MNKLLRNLFIRVNFRIPIFYLLLLLVIGASPIRAQRQTKDLPRQLVVKLKEGYSLYNREGRVDGKLWNQMQRQGAVEAESFLGSPEIQSRKRERLSPEQRQEAERIGAHRIYRLSFTKGSNVLAIKRMIERQEAVEYVNIPGEYEPLALPNDTYIQSGQMWWARKDYSRLYEAWGINKGDSSVVIAVVDTGCKTKHPELKNVLHYNEAERYGTAGVDDDGNGFVDDSLGYNFATPSSVVDEAGSTHGTIVSLMALAEVNNNFGLAGSGRDCRLMPLQHYDNAVSSGYQKLYEGIIYAAENGASIMVLPWGSVRAPLQYEQDIINYVTEVYDALVVASSGNIGNKEVVYYPASYDNVLSVAAYEPNYTNAFTYNYWVDIAGPGLQVRTSRPSNFSDVTSQWNGSSYSAPFVAGVAGLVRSQYPSLRAAQVAALLRQSADTSIYSSVAASRFEKLGGGAVDAYAAVTGKSSHRAIFAKGCRSITNTSSNTGYHPGDHIDFIVNFINYLAPISSSASVSISIAEGNATVSQGNYAIGALGTMDTASNNAVPFQITLGASYTDGEDIIIRLGYEDPTHSYTDFQFLRLPLQNAKTDGFPIEFYEMGVKPNGNIDYVQELPKSNFDTYGLDPIFRSTQILKEASLILATSKDTVSDAAMIDGATFSDDFYPYHPSIFSKDENISLENPSQWRTTIQSEYDDYSSNPGNPIGIEVEQKVRRKVALFKDFRVYFLEYNLTNKSSRTIDTLYAGFWADWDFPTDPTAYAKWDSTSNMAYVHSDSSEYIGVKPLNSNYTYYPLDLNGPVGDIDLSDSFSDEEKYKALADTHSFDSAGGAGGSDVAHLVGAKIFDFLPNETKQVAFLIALDSSLSGLQSMMNYASQSGELAGIHAHSEKPVEKDTVFCDNDHLVLIPDNEGYFYLYSDPSLTTLIDRGDTLQLTAGHLGNELYLVNRDHAFDSEVLGITPISGSIVAGLPGQAGAALATDFCIDASGGKRLQETPGSPYFFSYIRPNTPSEAFDVEVSLTQAGKPGEGRYYTFQDSVNMTQAVMALGYHWNFRNSSTFGAEPTVRIYFHPDDTTALVNGANRKAGARVGRTEAGVDVSDFEWIWTNDTDFSPIQNISPAGIDVPYSSITPSGSGVEDGSSYVEFNNLLSVSNGLSGGTANRLNGSIGGIVTLVGPLPIILASFTASPLPDQSVDLRWETAQEVESSHFVVERSVQGRAFSALGSIPSKERASSYRYIDYEAPLGAYIYYRLKMVDRDGSFSYSKVVTTTPYLAERATKIGPNPVSEWLRIQWSDKEQKGDIKLYNAVGQEVRRWEAQQALKQDISVKGLAPGMYLLELPNMAGRWKVVVR